MRLSLVIVAVLPVLLTCAVVSAQSALLPRDLRTEYTVNPLGIDALQPRLSWKLESAQRDQKQTGYQILVATAPAKLEPGQADLWDSGKVDSDATAQIAYAGKPMKSGVRAYWRVRVWDGQGQASNWTDPAWWEMGLLAKEDWHGQWIGRTEATDYTPAPLFRKTFEVKKKIRQARVYICGLGYHDLHLNGQKVGDHMLDPGYTRYDRRDLYVTHDVTAMLKEGKNAVGVILGTGWYNHHIKAVWDFEKAPWRAAPKLLMEMRVDYEDGTSETIVSDQSWKCSTGPITFDSIYVGETYDANLEKAGWDTAEYDDSKWDSVKMVKEPGGALTAQFHPAIRVTRTLVPVKVNQPRPGVFVYDFGQNFAGLAQLKINAPQGTKITMKYGERLGADGTVDQGKIEIFAKRGDKNNNFQLDTYVCKGGGTETWNARFSYKGFQWVEVAGAPGELTADNLKALVMHTAFDQVGQFECSDPRLNTIYKATCWSYISNAQGIPTDCPHREKNGWTGDAQLAAEFGLYGFDSPTFYTKWLNDLKDEMRPTGELPGICPTGGWGYKWGNGPAWDSAYVLIPWYLYQYEGDTRILEVHYDQMKRYVDYLTTKAKDSIVSIGLGDWVAVVKTPEAITSTGYYYIDARIVADAARILGKAGDAKKYDELAKTIKGAFQKKFVDAAKGQVGPGTQCAQACALYQRLVDAPVDQAVLANLLKAIEAKANHLDFGILGAKYVVNTLLDHGRPDVAYTIMMQKTAPSWWNWFERGATTLWEDWPDGASRNHIMYGDVSAWMFKAIAGIRLDPAAPGFKQFVIRPEIFSGITSCNATYESIRGPIKSAWKIENGKMTLKIQVPANTRADVYLPCADAGGVMESGKPVKQAQGVHGVEAKDGKVIVKVGSGQYEFAFAAK